MSPNSDFVGEEAPSDRPAVPGRNSPGTPRTSRPSAVRKLTCSFGVNTGKDGRFRMLFQSGLTVAEKSQ
jgi:hypothetical protein